MDRICREENLLAAWNATEASRSAEPAPSGELESFGERVLDNRADIKQRLAGVTQRPEALRGVEIPKSDGRGRRNLVIPSVSDRVAERAVLAVISPVVDPALQPDSYAFRPGLGVLDAVSAVQARVEEGADHLVRTDFVSCFDRVPRSRCLRSVGALEADEQDMRILSRCVHRAGGRGLAQGSPLSRLLMNVYLNGLDRALGEQDVHPIRYSDDVVVGAFGAEGLAAQGASASRLAMRSARGPEPNSVTRARTHGAAGASASSSMAGPPSVISSRHGRPSPRVKRQGGETRFTTVVTSIGPGRKWWVARRVSS